MSPPFRELGLFSSLPRWEMPWTDFLLSYGIQAGVGAIFGWIPILHPVILERPKPDYPAIELVPTPVPVNHQPQRQFPKRIEVAKLDPPPAAMRLPVPQPQPKPKVQEAPAPEVKMATRKLEPLPANAPLIPRPPVRTDVFSTGSSAPQTIDRAPQKVQTGGFGDPNGVPAKASQNKAVNIAQAGGFDLPAGSGYGNGTGGAHGARGVVASTGFGGGVATGNSSGKISGSRDAVRQGGFGDAGVVASTQPKAKSAEPVVKTLPAEITYKPRPVYTEEGRKLKIEGEVLVDVVFSSPRHIHIVNIVQRLGHGRDESAVRAAEKSQFKPALRDGQPADFEAVLHIMFQLAS